MLVFDVELIVIESQADSYTKTAGYFAGRFRLLKGSLSDFPR